MEKRFAGKVALVTGATSGIGQAAAVRLAAEGAVVAVNQRPTGDPRETLRRIRETGGEGFPVVADMRDPDAVISMVQETARRGGRLDHVVSNAGINPSLRWNETTVENFNALSETNFRGTWVVCTEAAKEMVREGRPGSIVIVSSISAHVGAPDQVAYCGTKGAISMLGKALGAVLGDHGIRVNVVEPGARSHEHQQGAARPPRGGEILQGEDRAAPHRGARRPCQALSHSFSAKRRATSRVPPSLWTAASSSMPEPEVD